MVKKTTTKKTATKKTAPDQTPAALRRAVDKLLVLRQKRQDAEAVLKKAKDAETEHAEALLGLLQSGKLTGVSGTRAKVTVTTQVVPKIDDYEKFERYVIRNKALDLLQRRVSVTAWRERLDAKKQVPGIEPLEVKKLHLTEVKR